MAGREAGYLAVCLVHTAVSAHPSLDCCSDWSSTPCAETFRDPSSCLLHPSITQKSAMEDSVCLRPPKILKCSPFLSHNGKNRSENDHVAHRAVFPLQVMLESGPGESAAEIFSSSNSCPTALVIVDAAHRPGVSGGCERPAVERP